MKLTEKKFFNPATGKMVGYVRAKNLGLVPTINSSRETQETDYGTFNVSTVRIQDLTFNPKIFKAMQTGTDALDRFISSEGGFMPATNIVLIGSPGIGKSTVGLDFITRIKRTGKSVLYISGEMGRIDMYRYCRRFPSFGELDILFLADYVKTNPVMAIEKVLEKGYDIVLVDSWAEVCRTVKDFQGVSTSKAESWLLDLMEKHNEAHNESETYTCFLMIQQVTKNGDFLGSNRMKHMTSAMLEMTRNRDEERNEMEFSKNRVGTAGDKISFSISRDSVRYGRV